MELIKDLPEVFEEFAEQRQKSFLAVKELKEKGLVEDAKLFFVQLKVSAYSGKLHSGVYTLNTSMTARDMMVLMAAKPEKSSTDDMETITDTTEETTEETTDTQTDADTVTGEE